MYPQGKEGSLNGYFVSMPLKYGLHKKSFILNATLVSCPFSSSLLGGFAVALLVGATANPPKSEDGNGQLTRVAFKINYFL
jgi:hypothetical protein